MDLMKFLQQYSLTAQGQEIMKRIENQRQWVKENFQLDSDGDVKVVCDALRELKACRHCDGTHCWKTYGQHYCINQIERCHGEYYCRRGNCKTYAPLTREMMLENWQRVFSGEADAIMDAGRRPTRPLHR